MSNTRKKIQSKRLIRNLYRLSMFAAIFGVLGFIFGLYLDLEYLALYHLVSSFAYLATALLAKKQQLLIARVIFFLFINLGIAVTSSFIGKPGSVEYLFMNAIALPFMMFSFKKEKRFVYFFAILSAVLWVILNATDFNLFTTNHLDPSVAANLIYPVSCITLVVFVFSQMQYFSKTNIKHYSKIYSKREYALEASEAKSKFLSTMSHEIRTPLNAVIGLSHILNDNNPREDQKENIEALNYSGKLLLNLLNNVLDFSKMQSTDIHLDKIPTNIEAAVKQLKKIHQPSCDRKNIKLDVKIDSNLPLVLIDVVRFNQVLNNLLSNAIKFTHQGKVSLIIKRKKSIVNEIILHVEVRDTGIGIPKIKQTSIWEAFTQASSSTTRIYGGTGLGLPIVKSIVNAMDSKIKILSKVGKGSRFIFDLKLDSAEETDIVTSNDKKEFDFEGKKVLLVDDNLINVMVGKQILEKAKLSVAVANDGLQAVNQMKENHFDIVLMDIQMPIMNGYTATEEIRKFNSTTPILALSAAVFMEIKDKVRNCGMNGYVFKPFNPEDLLKEIEKFTKDV